MSDRPSQHASDRPGHPVATIAALFDLSERRVQQLSADGVIPKNSHGRYELSLAVRGYVKYLRERAVKGDPAGADDVGASRASLLKARARLATLEADQAESTLLRRSDVEKVWSATLTNIRTRLLAIPQATAQAISHLTTPGQIAGLLTTAVFEALDDIAATPLYVDPARAADADHAAGDALGAAGAEAAASADGQPVGGREAGAERGLVGGAGEVAD